MTSNADALQASVALCQDLPDICRKACCAVEQNATKQFQSAVTHQAYTQSAESRGGAPVVVDELEVGVDMLQLAAGAAGLLAAACVHRLRVRRPQAAGRAVGRQQGHILHKPVNQICLITAT